MPLHAGDKKSNVRMHSSLLIGLLALCAMQAGAETKQENSLGIFSGWSFGLEKIFIKESPGGHTNNHYMPNFILGVYFQHNFSRSLGLQLNVNYQNCSNNSSFSDFWRYIEDKESLGCFSFSLNGIATVSRSAMTEYYVLGGIGMFSGAFYNHNTFLQFSGGIGVKLGLRPGSGTFINLAAVFHKLLHKYGSYLKLQAGLEFLLKAKQGAR